MEQTKNPLPEEPPALTSRPATDIAADLAPVAVVGSITQPLEPPSRDATARLFQEIRGWVPDFFFAALIALIIVFFVVSPVRVEGVSMLPRLEDQERIFVNRFIYHLTEIHRGDIVVFIYPRDENKSFIKRVIGLPGDVVEVKSGVVYVNGQRLDEPYLDPKFQDFENHGPMKVGLNAYYVLGDHRNQSNDSRHWGVVPRDNIYGKAMFRYWPVTRFGSIQ